MKIISGIIGVGNIGNEVAKRLAKAKFNFYVADVVANKVRAYEKQNLSLEKLIQKCNVIVLSLPGPDEVNKVIDTIIKIKKSKNCIVLDLSTSDAKTAINNSRKCSFSNISYIESPMVGGVRAVHRGKVNLIMAGDPKAIDRIMMVLKSFSHKHFRLTKYGEPSKMKLVHNMVTITNTIAAIEALILAKALKIELFSFVKILENGTASSYVIKNTIKRTLFKKKFVEGYKLKSVYKDALLIKKLYSALNVKPIFFDDVMRVLNSSISNLKDHDTDYPIVAKDIIDRFDLKFKHDKPYLDSIIPMTK